MKLLAIFTLALFTSCASLSPVGNWDYSVSGTPQGDFSGVLSVTKKGDGYSASMNSQAGDLVFNTFAFDKKTKTSTGTFYFSGVDVTFTATLDKVSMKGRMSAAGMDFPFQASKKK